MADVNRIFGLQSMISKFKDLLMVAALMFFSCSGHPGIMEQPKTVRAYAPEMNNMEMLNMTQLPGWQLLAGTQWIGNCYCNSIKGVSDKINACFYYDGNRPYSQSSMVKSGTSDGKTIYMNYMSAPDYLDYVFHRQFPNVNDARRTMLKTIDQYTDVERQQMEERRKTLYNASLQYYNQTASQFQKTNLHAQTVDRAAAEYKWVQNGDSIIHYMEVLINASYTEFKSPYLNSSAINWSQDWLLTATAPIKKSKEASEEIIKMISTIQFNENYVAMLNNIVMQGMQRNESESRRIQNEMAQAETRHQQRMSQMIQETNNYIANVHREVAANRQASMQRVSQGWRDAIVGVDRYMGADGKVVEVPVHMGNKVWQSAEGGTIYSSDSYLFRPVDYLPDKDGIEREFRQLQLLK